MASPIAQGVAALKGLFAAASTQFGAAQTAVSPLLAQALAPLAQAKAAAGPLLQQVLAAIINAIALVLAFLAVAFGAAFTFVSTAYTQHAAPLLAELQAAVLESFWFGYGWMTTVVVPFFTHYLGLAFVFTTRLVHGALTAAFTLVMLAINGGDADSDGDTDANDVTSAAGKFNEFMQAKVAAAAAIFSESGSAISDKLLAPLTKDGTAVEKALFAIFAYYCFAQVVAVVVRRVLPKGNLQKAALFGVNVYPFLALVIAPEQTPSIFRSQGLDETAFTASKGSSLLKRCEALLPFVTLAITASILSSALAASPATAETAPKDSPKAQVKKPQGRVTKGKKRN